MKQPFISFTERELGILLWKNDELKQLFREKVLNDFKTKDFDPSQADLTDWLQGKAPGSLITMVLSDIGGDIQGKKRGFRHSTSMMDLQELRDHLQSIQHTSFTPKDYHRRGYAHRGSIRTDGFRLQLLVFKLKELQSVRYRRLPSDVLPSRITTTVGGCDYYLTEIRNIVKTPQDVFDLWKCPPEDIKILGIDLGQACVVGASAILPKKVPKSDKVQMKETACDPDNDIEMKEPCIPGADLESKDSSDGQPLAPAPLIFHNLAVKQKAVYQPTFKHRRWMEAEKNKDPGHGLSSISAIETRLPPLSGAGANLTRYLTELGSVKNQLDEFYNGNSNRFKKHKWDAERAREEEYSIITDRLLHVLGGSIGAKKHEDNKAVIGIGLGKFSTKTRISSLHESFQSYFVQKVTLLTWDCQS